LSCSNRKGMAANSRQFDGRCDQAAGTCWPQNTTTSRKHVVTSFLVWRPTYKFITTTLVTQKPCEWKCWEVWMQPPLYAANGWREPRGRLLLNQSVNYNKQKDPNATNIAR